MVGRYADGEELVVGAYDEEGCMNKLIELQEKHGDLEWYSGYSDEDYEGANTSAEKILSMIKIISIQEKIYENNCK